MTFKFFSISNFSILKIFIRKVQVPKHRWKFFNNQSSTTFSSHLKKDNIFLNVIIEKHYKAVLS